jgi:hypothetical protein
MAFIADIAPFQLFSKNHRPLMVYFQYKIGTALRYFSRKPYVSSNYRNRKLRRKVNVPFSGVAAEGAT